MRKQIDLPDNLIVALKEVAKEDNRTVKSWMEHLIIKTVLKLIDEKE